MIGSLRKRRQDSSVALVLWSGVFIPSFTGKVPDTGRDASCEICRAVIPPLNLMLTQARIVLSTSFVHLPWSA